VREIELSAGTIEYEDTGGIRAHSDLLPNCPGEPGSKSGHDRRGRASFVSRACDQGSPCRGPLE